MFMRPGLRKATPSVEKYFLGPNRDLVFSWPVLSRSGTAPYRKLGPHLFASERAAVLIRHATERELALLEKGRFSRIAYVLDDDLDAIIRDPAINADYRRRVTAFLDDRLPRILRLATDVVAPSVPILARHTHAAVHFLGPALTHEPPGLEHFETEETLRIVFLGTRSHLHDLTLRARELEGFLKAHSDAHLETFLGKWAPPELRRLPNATHHPPLKWPAFRKMLKRRRWHVAIAPMRPTDVNRGRSWNKLLDHAAVGAATLASQGACPALDAALGHGKYGFLLAGKSGAWRDLLEWLHADRTQAARMAEAGASRARHIASPERHRTFWRRLLSPSGIEALPAHLPVFPA